MRAPVWNLVGVADCRFMSGSPRQRRGVYAVELRRRAGRASRAAFTNPFQPMFATRCSLCWCWARNSISISDRLRHDHRRLVSDERPAIAASGLAQWRQAWEPAPRRGQWRRAVYPYALLMLANFFWATNWIIGPRCPRGVPAGRTELLSLDRGGLDPGPVRATALAGQMASGAEHWWLFLVLGATGVATFQAIIYIGLNYTTAVNATILNAATPLVMVLDGVGRSTASRRRGGNGSAWR